MKFLKCKTCGVIVGVIQEPTDGVPFCGGDLEELIPNTTDAAGEKHVPVMDIDGSKVTVTVGEVEHPMLEAHSIQWIALETKQGMQRKPLAPGKAPKASFALAEGDEAVAAYEYCNLHGLWKAEA